MITSMTGFGSASADAAGVTCAVEIRSVNNRFYKATIKLPEKISPLETDVDRLLRDTIARGSVVIAIALKDLRPGASVNINQPTLDMYIHKMKELQATLGPAATIDLPALLMLPGVLETDESTEQYVNAHKGLVLGLVKEAADRLTQMRRLEGEALWQDLAKHLAIIREALLQIEKLAPNVSRQYHEKLRARVLQMVSDAKLSLSDSDLLKEVALFTDRADISEEIHRLGGHLDQFLHVCQNEDQAGRKLDFIAQELLREANTIASKANDSAISRLTVDIKSAIDRIKEQVQNVE
jgi:uncharacterized protein (TIGR00255 family)